MTRPSLNATLCHALVMALLAVSLYELQSWPVFVGLPMVSGLLPLSLVHTYLLYRNADSKSGQVLVMSLLMTMALLSTLFISLQWFGVLGMLFLNWLTRISLYQKNITQKCLDGALVILGVVWSLWVYDQSRSPHLAIWVFFLSQSLWALIYQDDKTIRCDSDQKTSRFDHAHFRAEQALSKLEV